MELIFQKCIRHIDTKHHVGKQIIPREKKCSRRRLLDGKAHGFFLDIFGQKIYFCFNGLKCSFGSLTPEQKNKFEKNNF
jgi:hypothetical protein